MEGGYVNEATINSNTHSAKFQNPFSAKQTPSLATTQLSPTKLQEQQQSAMKNASSPSLASPNSYRTNRIASSWQDLVQKVRNYDYNRVKNLKQHFHIEYVTKEKFSGMSVIGKK